MKNGSNFSGLIFVDHLDVSTGKVHQRHIFATTPLHIVETMFKPISFKRVVYIAHQCDGDYYWDGYCNGKVRWTSEEVFREKMLKLGKECEEIERETRLQNRKDILKNAILM